MPLPTTDFFERVLRALYEALCCSSQATAYISGVFRYDGQLLEEGDVLDLDGVTMTSREAAQLLMTFNGSRVHMQAQYVFGDDESPPGTYFTIVHPELIREGHKNRVGIYEEEGDVRSLFLDDVPGDDVLGIDVDFEGEERARAMHVDHFFLRRQAPDWLGTVAFALCAMVAHRLSYSHISLVAGGGMGRDARMVGYFFWPKLGFDAPLEEGEADGFPHLAGCRTIQNVLAIDEAWWQQRGSQRWMEFDLGEGSPAWEKLLDYLSEKELI